MARKTTNPTQKKKTSASNPSLLYLQSLKSPHSRRNMRRYLNQIVALLYPDLPVNLTNLPDDLHLKVDWSVLRYAHMITLKSRLSQRYAPATVNAMLSALRGVLRTAWNMGLIPAEEYQRAINVSGVEAVRVPAGRDLAYREIRALLEVCRVDTPDRQKPADIRDAALIALLYATGMRRAEVAALTLADYDRGTGRLLIQHGKGDHAREVFIRNRPQALLHAWLSLRGAHDGALFHGVRKNGAVLTDRGMTAQAIYNAIKKRGAQAGIRDFSPHDLRRTFVGDALDAGVDLATVSDIVGHASTETTRRYDRRSTRAKEKAANLMDI